MTPLAVGTNVREPDCVVPIRTLASVTSAQPPPQATNAQQDWQVVGPPAKAPSPSLPVVSGKPAPAASSAPVRRPSPARQKQLNHKQLRIADVEARLKARDAAKQQQQQKVAADDR